MRAKPSKIVPLFMQCGIYFFILHLLLQFSFLCGESRIVCLRRTKVRFSMAQLLQLNIWNEKSVQ